MAFGTESIQTNVREVSPFLKLPGELRNLIYRHLLCDKECFKVKFGSSSRLLAYGSRSGNSLSNLTSIAANHQLRQETRRFFFTQNKFHVFDMDKSVRYVARAFLAAIGPFGRAHLRHLEMPTHCSAIVRSDPSEDAEEYTDRGFNIVFALLTRCKELEFLRIGFNLVELCAMFGMENRGAMQTSRRFTGSQHILVAVLTGLGKLKTLNVLEIEWKRYSDNVFGYTDGPWGMGSLKNALEYNFEDSVLQWLREGLTPIEVRSYFPAPV